MVETGHFPSWPRIAIRRPVHFVQPLHRTGLSVAEDHGFADKLGLGLFELAEDRGRADLSQLAW
jgi:hypothetical protein